MENEPLPHRVIPVEEIPMEEIQIEETSMEETSMEETSMEEISMEDLTQVEEMATGSAHLPMDTITLDSRKVTLMKVEPKPAAFRRPMDSVDGRLPMGHSVIIPSKTVYAARRWRMDSVDGCRLPMGHNVIIPSKNTPIHARRDNISPISDSVDNGPTSNKKGCEFTREKVFNAATQGDAAGLLGLLDYLQKNKKHLTSPEFKDETNGKTALLKALLNLKNGKNDTIDVLLYIAEKTGDLENLINASYTDDDYKGQTPLHVAIERRSFKYMQLLVNKGANVQAKATGEFFQPNAKLGFYFGELPLSLAACTDQLHIMTFLMGANANVRDKDSQGNTVLHILVVMADNTEANTKRITEMYDSILTLHNSLEKTRQNSEDEDPLEKIKNNEGLTPLTLAAKLGKIELLRHMLQREFKDEEMSHLSRRFTEWVYGPVHCSLYDISSVDTNENDSTDTKENNSVLEIIVFGSDIPNRPEMLEIEPLHSLLEEKWDMFASKLFLMNFLVYLIYLIIFTTVVVCRKDGQPPFPVERPLDYLRCVGEIISVLGALRFLYQSITFFQRNRPNFQALFTDGFIDILFFLQATMLLVCTVLYFCGRREYVGLLVLSLALAWINVLYYSRGSKRLGKYYVMMQNMILGDLLHFLCVYSVFLFGFSAAVVALVDKSPPNNMTNASVPKGQSCDTRQDYRYLHCTMLEMFKFTIGMGDLQFTDRVVYKEVFYILLICYIVLTYILALNMLIALMGNTVERISSQSEIIWNLQRAFTILDLERSLPTWLRKKLQVRKEQDEYQGLFRVEEKNWKQWTSDLGIKRKEDPPLHTPSGSHWNVERILERIKPKRHPSQQDGFP